MAGKPKKTKLHTDDQGHYVWENFFVRGKQRRTKRRVTVIGGKVIDDPDAWLLANADDAFLHQIERWDLIDRRGDEEETDALFADGNHLVLPADLFEGLFYGALDEFVDSLADDPQRGKLAQAIRGKGAFRRFKDIVFGGGDAGLKHCWLWFETRRKRERIVEWLRDENIEPEWGRDILEASPLPDKRADLLRAVLTFVRDARRLPGVRRIALLGSLTTPKAIPKDVDLLVELADDMPLDPLARLSRQLLGKTMQTGDGCGADVFLCNPQGEYLGRICSWKTCCPGIRQGCQAQHCGRRGFLSDDLQAVRLDPPLIAAPPLELWPEVVVRTGIPDDVREELVAALG